MHQTINKNDTYLGSGTYLLLAIKKYGRKNFVREILFECLDREEMLWREEAMVVIFDRRLSYNIYKGGMGGAAGRIPWNKGLKDSQPKRIGWKHSEENLQKMRKPRSERGKESLRKARAQQKGKPGHPQTPETIAKIIATKKRLNKPLPPIKESTRELHRQRMLGNKNSVGRTASEHTKALYRERSKDRIWIMNPETKETKMIKNYIEIPAGWVRGRPKKEKKVKPPKPPRPKMCFITDFKAERQIPVTEEIPTGWTKGRHPNSYKLTAHSDNNKNTIYIFNSDTLECKRIKNAEVIPEGWERGRRVNT